MSEFMMYSEEWKKEMKKLPKETIIEIASMIGKEKQAEIDSVKKSNSSLLDILDKARSVISSLKNSMRAHPDHIEGSEFDDYTDLAQETENEIEELLKPKP